MQFQPNTSSMHQYEGKYQQTEKAQQNFQYRIVHSDGPPSNFKWIFVLIKVVAKSMTLRMFVVPTQIKDCCQNLRLTRIFCFWAQSWRMQQNWSVHFDGPASQILIKSQSDQKMPQIFPLCIANSWPHTKFCWPMSPRSESRANSTLCSKSKSYFNENSGLVH